MHLEHRCRVLLQPPQTCGTYLHEYRIPDPAPNTYQDKCNEGGENGKQGGTYEDQCARWHMQFI
jgi:hypothetical protein